MKNHLAIAMAAAVIAGCGNGNEPKTAPTVPIVSPQGAPSVPATPPPAAPKAVDDGIQRPTPGQANDHSSPNFDAGGRADPKK